MTTINRFGGHKGNLAGTGSGKTGDGIRFDVAGSPGGMKGGFSQILGSQRNEQRLDVAFMQEFEKLKLEWEGKQPVKSGDPELQELKSREGFPPMGREGHPDPLAMGIGPETGGTARKGGKSEGKSQPVSPETPLSGISVTGEEKPPRGAQVQGEQPGKEILLTLLHGDLILARGKKPDPAVQKETGVPMELAQQPFIPPEKIEQGKFMERGEFLLSKGEEAAQLLGKMVERRQEAGESGLRKEKEPEMSWLASLETLPLIAQSAPGVLTLFQPTAPVQQVQGSHPVVTHAEDIVLKLVERAELGPLPSLKDMSNVHLSLDRSIYGISGVGLSVTQGAVSVVLIGTQSPDSEALAAAGQVLVRELQKHFPNRSVRILAKDEDRESGGIAGVQSEVEAPILALSQREFTQDSRK